MSRGIGAVRRACDGLPAGAPPSELRDFPDDPAIVRRRHVATPDPAGRSARATRSRGAAARRGDRCRGGHRTRALSDPTPRIMLMPMSADARPSSPSLETLLVSRDHERAAERVPSVTGDAAVHAPGRSIGHRSRRRAS